jgi:hypothetical protein
MAAQVLSFFQRSPRYAPKPTDWTQQELAEFYRVESALIRAGIRVGTDRGMSDENEPWFIFYRSDDGEVVIHFARIDGEYIIAGPAYEEIARGFDFSTLVRNMVARHPLIRRSESSSNLSIHPAALLVAVVGTAFFKTGEARAAETGATNTHASHSRPVLLSSSSNASLTNGAASAAVQQPSYDTVQIPANQAVLVLAAALLASDYSVDTTSIDPIARGALASAAASLDYTGVQTPHSSVTDAGLPLASASHAAVVDNTPAQTVSTVLSLVAILSTLPQTMQPAAVQAITSEIDSGKHDHVAGLSPSLIDSGNWSIDVRLDLSSPGLPSVEAVQLVRSLLGDEASRKIMVIEVAKLPDVLTEILGRGEHYSTTPTPGDQTSIGPGLPNTPPPSTGGGSVETPTPGDSSPPSDPTPAKPDHPAYASLDMVKQFIDYFIAHAPVVDIVVNGAEIIILDHRVLNDMSAIVHLDSMTFHFTDGSSVSLVGDHSSLLHDGNLS